MKKIVKKLWTGAAALALCFSFAACNTGSADLGSENGKGSEKEPHIQTACTYLAIDINPTVELLVRGDKVVGVKAGNDDASVLLSGEDLIGLTVEEASEKIVGLAEKMGYLHDGNKKVKITVLSDDAGEAKEVEDAAKAGAEKGSGKAEVNSDPRSRDERTVKKLQAENPELYKDLTPAKVRLIEAIMQYDRTMTYEKGAAMKVSELAELLEDLAEEYEDLVSDELEDKFEERYEAAKAETQRKIAAVYGEEYLAAWERYAALETAYDVIEDKAENASLSDADIQAVMELLGISDKELISENGVVTPDSVDDYLDKHFDDDKEEREEDEDAAEEIEDAVEEILDKYDEEHYTLTEEDLAALSEAWGEALTFAALEEAEEFLDEREDALDERKDSIELNDEQKAQISALKEELKTLKRKIREEMKAEIGQAKEEIKRRKEQMLG